MQHASVRHHNVVYHSDDLLRPTEIDTGVSVATAVKNSEGCPAGGEFFVSFFRRALIFQRL